MDKFSVFFPLFGECFPEDFFFSPNVLSEWKNSKTRGIFWAWLIGILSVWEWVHLFGTFL